LALWLALTHSRLFTRAQSKAYLSLTFQSSKLRVLAHLQLQMDECGRQGTALIGGSGLITFGHSKGEDATLTRDAGLEQLVSDDLADLADITTTKMFGGFAWIWQGHLLCAARTDGILFRLGKGNAAWTGDLPGIAPMVMGGRLMDGWVRLTGDAVGDDALRQRLMAAARTFVSSLPPK
jgi:hypothetical protein